MRGSRAASERAISPVRSVLPSSITSTSNSSATWSRAATTRVTARSTFASSFRPGISTVRLTRVALAFSAPVSAPRGAEDMDGVLVQGVVVAQAAVARELALAEGERLGGGGVGELGDAEVHLVAHQVEGDRVAAQRVHAPHHVAHEGAPVRVARGELDVEEARGDEHVRGRELVGEEVGALEGYARMARARGGDHLGREVAAAVGGVEAALLQEGEELAAAAADVVQRAAGELEAVHEHREAQVLRALVLPVHAARRRTVLAQARLVVRDDGVLERFARSLAVGLLHRSSSAPTFQALSRRLRCGAAPGSVPSASKGSAKCQA